MKYLYAFLLSFSLVFASSTQHKINKNKKNLKKAHSIERVLNKKLDDIAKDIIKDEKALNDINDHIAKLQEQINSLKLSSKDNQKKLQNLLKENKQLVKTKKQLEERLVKIIADKFSFYLISDKSYQESIESIIGSEVLDKTDTILKQDFKNLSYAYNATNSIISRQNAKIKNIKSSLNELSQKENKLKKTKLTRQANLNKLKKNKQAYKKKLERIVAQRVALKKTLQKLKILKSHEDEEAKRRKKSYKKVKVRQVGSSYQQANVKHYKGSRTISPLRSYVVKQKFGNYKDPLYGIKIFNESVILRSKIKNAKVRNVLKGKVIFAKDTAMLDKVVIVENKNGIHTIYAHLDKIAPTIRVGKKIKKSYVIGRVDRDLTFEVTQKNYHINPMELIR